jgi:3-hydroxyisobutyrate dehydrogenase
VCVVGDGEGEVFSGRESGTARPASAGRRPTTDGDAAFVRNSMERRRHAPLCNQQIPLAIALARALYSTLALNPGRDCDTNKKISFRDMGLAPSARALAAAALREARAPRPPSLARGFWGARAAAAAASPRRSSSAAAASASSSSASPPPPATVAFIGLGNMGLPMAVNLVKRGHNVVAVDLSNDNVSSLERAAAAAAAEAAAAAGAAAAGTTRPPPGRVWRAPTPVAALDPTSSSCPVSAVVTMLPATRHAREVYEHPRDGVLAGLQAAAAAAEAAASSTNTAAPGSPSSVLLCDCSTVSPLFARDLARATPSPHIVVDAPVSGGVPAARDAALTFMVGCRDDTAFARALPLLQAMGRRVVRCGSTNGAGLVAKIANNLALAVQYAGVCEALALAAKSGVVDPLLLSRDVFAHSSAACWSIDKYSPVPGAVEGAPANHGYRAGFGAGLMVKDLELALELAKDAGFDAPLAEAARALYARVVRAAELRGEDPRRVDFSALYRDVYGVSGLGRGGG